MGKHSSLSIFNLYTDLNNYSEYRLYPFYCHNIISEVGTNTFGRIGWSLDNFYLFYFILNSLVV